MKTKPIPSIGPELRFRDIAQWEKYKKSGKASDSVPTHIEKGRKLIPNPEYESAPFAQGFVFSDGDNAMEIKSKQ